LEAFEFRSDFASVPCDSDAAQLPEPEQLDKISLSGAELATLLAEARNEGINEAKATHDTSHQERLDGVTTKLNEALANLVVLANLLEGMGEENAGAARTLFLINAVAANILDGQGDLFADRKGLHATVIASGEIALPETEDTP
jgi:hypothetical protein